MSFGSEGIRIGCSGACESEVVAVAVADMSESGGVATSVCLRMVVGT